MAELTNSYSTAAEARAAARSAYARHSEDHATPTRRPSRRSRHSQGSHFELARRRSTRSNASTSTQKQEPAAVLSITTVTTSIPEAAGVSTPRAPQSEPSPKETFGLDEQPADVTASPDTPAARTVHTNTPTPTPRHFSINIKGRLKQVFRKSTPAPIVPVAPPTSPDPAYNEPPDAPSDAPPDTVQAAVPAEEPPANNAISEPEPFSRPYSTSTRSRVTSWTNSTIAAVSSIRSRRRPSHQLELAAQPLPESTGQDLRKKSSFFVSPVRSRTQPDVLAEPILEANSRELRKKGSFFGGPVRNRLHRGSRADLKESSEESMGLYSALQKRIRPAKSERAMSRQRLTTPLDASELEDTTLFEPTLPTIRTITPEPGTRAAYVPSPVTEVVSPGSSLKRRSALRVPHARADVISPSVYSRGTDGVSLRPLSPEGDEGTTTILITGREVRRYSISPAKPQSRHHRGNGSGSWRKWLSDEMRTSLGTTGPGYQSLNVPSDEQYLQARRTPSPAMQYFAQDSPSPARSHTVHHGAHGSGTWRKWLSDEMRTTLGNTDQQFRLLNSEKLRPRSISPLSEAADDPARSRSRASSIVSTMNDRYPRIAPSPASLRDQQVVLPSFRPPSRSSRAEIPRPPTRQSIGEPMRPPSGLGQPIHARLPSRNRPLHTFGSKENVRPPSISSRAPESPLPALSSSQWLATGSQHRKRTEVRKPSLKDAVMKPSLSRLSARQSTFSMREPPLRDGYQKPASLTRQSMMEMRDSATRRSPGQHMVTDWLNERKGREGVLGNRQRAELEDTSVSAFL